MTAPETGRGEAGQSPRLNPIKRGRPKIGEAAQEPWKAFGLTERTYYRRKAAGTLP